MAILSESVTLAHQLIGFNTLNPGGSEAACTEFLSWLLKNAGFNVVTASFEDGRPSITLRLGEGLRPALCFVGHTDTVPLGEAPWSVNPFSGVIHNDRIYGRGTSDMKSGIAAMVTAACRLAPRLAHSDDLIIVIVAGEETGCQGSRFLADRAGLLGNAGALIVAEPTENYPLVGHKGALWLKAIFSGRTAHGAMPERGDNAVYKAAAGIQRLINFDFGVTSHPYLGDPTQNVGYFHGGLNINSVPDAAEVGIDIRTIPSLDHENLIHKMRIFFGSDAVVSPFVDVNALWTDPDLPWVYDVYGIVESILNYRPEPKTVAFFTNGAPLQAAYGGIPTMILGPGASAMAHQTDEYCPVADIDNATSIYELIAEKWYGL